MANKPNLISVPGQDGNGNAVSLVNALIWGRGSQMFSPVWQIPVMDGLGHFIKVPGEALYPRHFMVEPAYSVALSTFEVWGVFEFGPGYVDQHYLAEWYLENLAQPIVYTVDSGILPPGLTLSNIGATAQGQIEGTPTQAGTYDFVLRATGPATDSTKLFSIEIIDVDAGTGYLYGN